MKNSSDIAHTLNSPLGASIRNREKNDLNTNAGRQKTAPANAPKDQNVSNPTMAEVISAKNKKSTSLSTNMNNKDSGNLKEQESFPPLCPSINAKDVYNSTHYGVTAPHLSNKRVMTTSVSVLAGNVTENQEPFVEAPKNFDTASKKEYEEASIIDTKGPITKDPSVKATGSIPSSEKLSTNAQNASQHGPKASSGNKCANNNKSNANEAPPSATSGALRGSQGDFRQTNPLKFSTGGNDSATGSNNSYIKVESNSSGKSFPNLNYQPSNKSAFGINDYNKGSRTNHQRGGDDMGLQYPDKQKRTFKRNEVDHATSNNNTISSSVKLGPHHAICTASSTPAILTDNAYSIAGKAGASPAKQGTKSSVGNPGTTVHLTSQDTRVNPAAPITPRPDAGRSDGKEETKPETSSSARPEQAMGITSPPPLDRGWATTVSRGVASSEGPSPAPRQTCSKPLTMGQKKALEDSNVARSDRENRSEPPQPVRKEVSKTDFKNFQTNREAVGSGYTSPPSQRRWSYGSSRGGRGRGRGGQPPVFKNDPPYTINRAKAPFSNVSAVSVGTGPSSSNTSLNARVETSQQSSQTERKETDISSECLCKDEDDTGFNLESVTFPPLVEASNRLSTEISSLGDDEIGNFEQGGRPPAKSPQSSVVRRAFTTNNFCSNSNFDPCSSGDEYVFVTTGRADKSVETCSVSSRGSVRSGAFNIPKDPVVFCIAGANMCSGSERGTNTERVCSPGPSNTGFEFGFLSCVVDDMMKASRDNTVRT